MNIKKHTNKFHHTRMFWKLKKKNDSYKVYFYGVTIVWKNEYPGEENYKNVLKKEIKYIDEIIKTSNSLNLRNKGFLIILKKFLDKLWHLEHLL